MKARRLCQQTTAVIRPENDMNAGGRDGGRRLGSSYSCMAAAGATWTANNFYINSAVGRRYAQTAAPSGQDARAHCRPVAGAAGGYGYIAQLGHLTAIVQYCMRPAAVAGTTTGQRASPGACRPGPASGAVCGWMRARRVASYTPGQLQPLAICLSITTDDRIIATPRPINSI